MADNIELDAGSGGAIVAADDIAGVWYQIGKLAFGAADSATLADSNSGNKSAGTLRVVLATDQPQLTNKLLVTPDLPSGASTSAKQDTIITAVELLDDAVYVDDADWADNTSKHVLVGGVYQSAPHTVTDGDVSPFLTDANGRLVVAATDNGGSLSIDDGGNTITVDGTVAVTNAGLTELAAAINGSSQMDVNLAASNANVTVVGTGTLAVQVDGAALTALQLIDDTVAVLGTATYTETTSKGNVIAAVRRDADTTLVDTTNEMAPLQVDARGALKVEAFSGETLPVSLASVPSHAVTNAGTFVVQPNASATGGTDTFNGTSSDGGTAVTNSSQVVKGGAGALYGWYIYNPNDEVSYVNVYNTASASVTVGTTNPKFQIPVPPLAAANLLGAIGIDFGTAIAVSATKTAGSNTAPDVAMEVVLFYK